MKTFHRTFIALIFGAGLILSAQTASAWGQKGHDVTCAIAERHLTPKAQKRISELFNGKSIVYWANWMDNASHTPDFKYTSTWHYKNIDADETYETAALNENGDVVTAIDAMASALKSGQLNKDQAALDLKFLVHLVGDLHCPMHMAHKSDRGGNRWQIQYFNNPKNLHGIWDTDLVESAHKWTYTEWADQIDRAGKAEQAAITAGTLNDWGKETFTITQKIYDSTPEGSKLSYDYVSEWAPVIEQQFLRGGLRLAALLNYIFG